MANSSFLFSLDEGDSAEYDALYDLYEDYRKADFCGRRRSTVDRGCVQIQSLAESFQRDYFDGDIAGGISQLFDLENYDSTEY